MEIILTHNNADFDAAAALLAAYKLNPNAIPVLPERTRRNVAEFVTLYQSGLPFVQWADFRARNIHHILLVDTQRMPELRNIKANIPTDIIDHHPLKQELKPHQTFHGETVGANTTLLVEQIERQGIALSSLEATLMALGIYEDTGSLSYKTTTARDIRAAAWLLEQGAVLDTVRRFLGPPLTEEQQALYETLLATLENRNIQGYTVTVAAAKVDTNIPEVNSVAHRLRDVMDTAAIFLLVEMPSSLQLVCRTTGDAVDSGEVARLFGGGGHQNAAAATIKDLALDEAVDQLWQQLYRLVRPVTRVAELMSYGVQTVDPGRRVSDIIQQMRRIGHEGYPVVEGGRVIGLLTRREADRAIEHGLGNLTVREIMSVGEVTLTPRDSVSTLEQILVQSGWGQIPVVDENDALIGIVTRTDLIQHWAHTHPTTAAVENIISSKQIEVVLGRAAATFITMVASHAQQADVTLYLVGGAVRDLLLHRRNLDLDFVVEGDAIGLAKHLCEIFGGHISSHKPFGTAKWLFNGEVAEKMGLNPDALPDHIDFATSRNEFYEHPTALPTVYNSSIKLDLQRRDFTVNTLAVQLSPASAMGHILDFYGGLHDLDHRLIRVLHSLSFVDDPTRILRAVRFEQRLGFTIEPRTAELIDTALPMLRRITGERLRNELTLLLREIEPESGLLKLQRRGVTEAIHPAFVIQPEVAEYFEAVRTYEAPWPIETPPDITELYWHVIASMIPPRRLVGLCDRLIFGRTLFQSLIEAAELVQEPAVLAEPEARPSQIVEFLEGRSEQALLVGWIMLEEGLAKARIQRYMLEWRHIQPITNGHVLRALGLVPGPRYRVILDRLRTARLDGDIQTDQAEQELLQQLIIEGDSEDDRT